MINTHLDHRTSKREGQVIRFRWHKLTSLHRARLMEALAYPALMM